MDSTDEAEAAAAAAVGAFDMKLAEEFGERRARVYSRVVKSQIAGVRQAERLEIARGMVAARNAARDERIQAIRQARIAEDSARAKASREIRRAAKDDLAYRQMYQAALASAKEKLLMEIQAGHSTSTTSTSTFATTTSISTTTTTTTSTARRARRRGGRCSRSGARGRRRWTTSTASR